MRKIDKIVQSETAPGPDSLWIHDGELLWFNNGKWKPVIKSSEPYDDSALVKRVSSLEGKVNKLETADIKLG